MIGGLALAAFAALLIVAPPAVIRLADWRKRRAYLAREAREIAEFNALVADMPELAERGPRIIHLSSRRARRAVR